MSVTEINSVSEWNTSLRGATAAGRSVVVDFHATWCAPCKQIAPLFEKFAEHFPQVLFLRVNVDTQKAIAQKYQVTAMPTFYAFKGGKVVDMLRGADPNGLRTLVARHAGPNPPIPPLPEKAEAARSAGNDHYKKGEYEEAIEKYNEAILLVPDSAPLLANRSISHLKLNPPNTTAAAEDAKQATVVDPKWAKGWIRLGDALLANGAPESEVKNAFESGLALLPEGSMRAEAQEKLKSVTVSAAM